MWLFAAILAWPLVEIALFVVIGGWIGLWPTLAWVLVSAGLGALVLRRVAARQAVALGGGLRGLADPAQLAAGGLLGGLAGVLLILPGFLSDALGLLLLLPPVQALVARLIRSRVQVVQSRHEVVIDGEYTEVTPQRNGPSGWTRID